MSVIGRSKNITTISSLQQCRFVMSSNKDFSCQHTLTNQPYYKLKGEEMTYIVFYVVVQGVVVWLLFLQAIGRASNQRIQHCITCKNLSLDCLLSCGEADSLEEGIEYKNLLLCNKNNSWIITWACTNPIKVLLYELQITVCDDYYFLFLFMFYNK